MGKSVTKTTNTNISETETSDPVVAQGYMSYEAFVYWLQGYFELSGTKNLSPEQVRIIKEHLNLALKKVTTTTLTGFQGFC